MMHVGFRFAVCCVVALVCCASFAVEEKVAKKPAGPKIAAPVAPSPGLVKTKPASGRFVETAAGFMVPYKAMIPGTDATYEMVPIPGGKFLLGSPASEKGREKVEGPQIEVTIAPFWMGKYEITWAEYKQFMGLYDTFKDLEAIRELLKNDLKREPLLAVIKPHGALTVRVVKNPHPTDAITAPTKLYEPSYTFKLGERPKQPAATMTQYAAKQYTKWLSRLHGRFYRLPTEAEWEYAARAGSKTAFHFGDDPKKLGDYAWYTDNSDEKTHDVGQKKPNPWGLYDIHGNVAEWVLDEYMTDGYARLKGKPQTWESAIAWPKKQWPRVVRGGSWDDDAEYCRSAAKLGSEDEEWKDEDPNLPLSPWWYTTDPARGVGFRLVRPLAVPAEVGKYWDIDHRLIALDVGDRVKEGRGATGSVNTSTPKVQESLEVIREQLKTLLPKKKVKGKE